MLALLEQKAEIFRVIVAVPCHDIECHPQKRLPERFVAQAQFNYGHKELGISVRAALLIVQVVHRAQCLDVVLDRFPAHQLAIKA